VAAEQPRVAPPTRSTPPHRSRRTLLVFVLIALIPIAGAAIRLHRAGWVPEGDDAMIARRTMAVFSAHPPITGQPSTAGALFTHEGGRTHAASIEASHPGPLEYYLLAVPYRLSGWSPAGLLVSVALINGAAAAAVVWLAWRRLGTAGAAAGALAVLFVAAHLGAWNLARPLNAGIAVLPMLAGLVGAWAVIDRDRVAIVPSVLALSLVIQAHLGAAPLAGAALVAAIAAEAWWWWHDRSTARRAGAGEAEDAGETPAQTGAARSPARTARVPVWAIRVGAVALLVLCWVLVLGEQLSGHPGNLSRLADVARLRIDRAGARFGVSAVFDQVVQPAWPGMPPLPRISIIGPIGLGPSLAKGALLIVAFGLAVWWSRRAGRADLVRLVAVAAGATLVPIFVLTRGPDEVRLGPSYQLTSLLAVGGLVVLGLGATVAAALEPRLTAKGVGPRLATATAVVLGIAALAGSWWSGPTYREDATRTRAIADAIRHQVPKGRYKLQATGTWAYLSTLDAVSVELLRHGYDIREVRLGGIPDEPVRRDTNVRAPTIMLDSTDAPRTDGKELIRRRPLSQDPTWAKDLLAAVSAPDVDVAADHADRWPSTASPCLGRVRRLAGPEATDAGGAAEQARGRRALVKAVLSCSQTDRRLAMSHLAWAGIDQFWLDLLGSNMPGPYPHTGLAAYLIPVPPPTQP
jgi:hypothetical protein